LDLPITFHRLHEDLWIAFARAPIVRTALIRRGLSVCASITLSQVAISIRDWSSRSRRVQCRPREHVRQGLGADIVIALPLFHGSCSFALDPPSHDIDIMWSLAIDMLSRSRHSPALQPVTWPRVTVTWQSLSHAAESIPSAHLITPPVPPPMASRVAPPIHGVIEERHRFSRKALDFGASREAPLLLLEAQMPSIMASGSKRRGREARREKRQWGKKRRFRRFSGRGASPEQREGFSLPRARGASPRRPSQREVRFRREGLGAGACPGERRAFLGASPGSASSRRGDAPREEES
jgi:hypothetical protein